MRPTNRLNEIQARLAQARGDHQASQAAAEAYARVAPALGADARRRDAFVATPPALATQLVDLLQEHAVLPERPWILEPSAGHGALVRAITGELPGANITAVEPNWTRAGLIPRDDLVEVRRELFEDFTPERAYDGVVMNPPFSVPGQRDLWIDHVNRAWDMVAPGGALVAVAPAGFTYRVSRKHQQLRELVDEHGGCIELPSDTFRDSGANVNAVVIHLTAPID